MKPATARSKVKPFLKPPKAEADDGVAIRFGYNAPDRKVLMYFPAAEFQIVYTPAEARDVAQKLAYYADLADGTAAM